MQEPPSTKERIHRAQPWLGSDADFQGDGCVSPEDLGCYSEICLLTLQKTSLVTQMVKTTPALQDTWVQSLGWEDPLEEGVATHSSILTWRIPMDRGAWQTTVLGVAKSWT